MKQHTCSTCYWQQDKHCYYNPPAAQLLMAQGLAGGPQPQPVAFHPPVRDSGFCSKHSSLTGLGKIINLN